MIKRSHPNARLRACHSWVGAGLCLLAAAAVGTASARGQASTPAPDEASRVFVSDRNINAPVSEDERVGPNEQPEWTTRRVFAETDIYVIPPGTFEYNQYYLSTHPRNGVPGNLFESEFELGLPFRSQFDVELDYSIHHGGKLRDDGTLFELPHALAKWGRIPFNPTVDGGWRTIKHETGAYFLRMLLAEEFSKRLHFGADFTFDRQVGSDRETSFEVNQALSYLVINSKLSVGYEFRLEYEREQADSDDDGDSHSGGPSGSGSGDDDGDTGMPGTDTRRHGGRFEHTLEVLLGPSVLYRPTRSTYLSLIPLVGLTHDSSYVEAYFIFGIDFGPRVPSKEKGGEGEQDDDRALVPHSRHRMKCRDHRPNFVRDRIV